MDMPTPPASSIAPSTHPNPLPQPRKHPLKPGSPKESNLINYLDRTIDGVRYKIRHKTWDKPPPPHHHHRHKHSPPSPKRRRISQDDDPHDSQPPDESQPNNQAPKHTAKQGYKTFLDLSRDLEQIIDVVWVSSSPNLQIPYLLTVTSILIDSLPLFSPIPWASPSYRAALLLLDKLDFAFSALMVGRDPDTGVGLPGFEAGRRVSATERVRVRSAVDRARMVVMEALGDVEDDEVGGGGEMGDDGEEGDDEEEEDVEEVGGMRGRGAGRRAREDDDGTVRFEGFENNDDDDDDDDENASAGVDDADERRKALGRVFERTLGELGDMLGELEPIGINTGN